MIPETNLAGLFFKQARRYDDRTFLERKSGSKRIRWSWRETAERVEALALYLTSRKGPVPSEPCALISENRPEWVATDLGVLTASNHDVPLYPTSTPDEIRFSLTHSKSRYLFLSNDEQLKKIIPIEGELTHLEEVITFDPCQGKLKQKRLRTLDEVLTDGRALK